MSPPALRGGRWIALAFAALLLVLAVAGGSLRVTFMRLFGAPSPSAPIVIVAPEGAETV